MASHNATGRMVLRPDAASIIDLFQSLLSEDVEKIRKFVEFPEEKIKEIIVQRGLIFISVFAQKFLLSVSKPMSWFGSELEDALNLPLSDGNLGVLLLNFFQGKGRPYKKSAAFLSFVGKLDTRVDLDKTIKHGDRRYYPALSAMASKIAYENEAFVKTTVEDHWEMEFIWHTDFWNDFLNKPATQGFMLHDKNADPDMIIVAFRGTSPFDAYDWCSDFDISWYELPGMGKIHGGFMKALGLQSDQSPENNYGWPREKNRGDNPLLAYYDIREKLRDHLRKNNRTKFIMTGHSLGGALAILFPAILAFHKEFDLLKRLEGVYTFGQPMIGDEEFGNFMEQQLQMYGIRYLRFVYSNDLVPRLPSSTFLFKHFGKCVYFDSCYEGKIVSEQPKKNYFSPMQAIPMSLNAVWELLRSFTIQYTAGPDYCEGLLLKMVRVLGVILPGFSAHVPQDYVNASRLWSPDT